jgi:HAD superfamily hydrolase (TIGR01509 family)
MSEWPAAVIFDFDGVIVNSEPLHYRAFAEILADEGITLSEDEYYAEYIGFDDRGAFNHLLTKYNRPAAADELRRLMSAKARRAQELIARRDYDALPGARELVHSLSRNGYLLGICSGALRPEIEGMLAGVELRQCFAVITGAEDVTVGKPDPMGYLLTARLLGERAKRKVEPRDCLVVEDAPTVIASVQTAGFRALGVATTYGPEKLAGADFVVDSLRPATVKRAVPQLRLD